MLPLVLITNTCPSCQSSLRPVNSSRPPSSDAPWDKSRAKKAVVAVPVGAQVLGAGGAGSDGAMRPSMADQRLRRLPVAA